MTVEVLLGNLVRWARGVLPTKDANLLPQTMVGGDRGVNPLMVDPSALEKGVASLNVIHMHVGIALLLLKDHLEGPTITEEEISMKGTVISKLILLD